jgi:hypothetical protein
MSGKARRIAAQRGARIGGQELELSSSLLDRITSDARQAYLVRRLELAPLPPVAERSDTREAPWQKQIVEVATRLGYWSHHPHLSQYSSQGVPDLFLLHEQRRRALWIECKDDRNHLSEFQVEVIDRMRACGLEVHVFRPWHGLEAVAEVLQRG